MIDVAMFCNQCNKFFVLIKKPSTFFSLNGQMRIIPPNTNTLSMRVSDAFLYTNLYTQIGEYTKLGN